MAQVARRPVRSAGLADTRGRSSGPLTSVDTRLWLLAAWSCPAFGNAMSGGSYSPDALFLVALGTGLLVLAVVLPSGSTGGRFAGVAFGAVLLLGFVGAVLYPTVHGVGEPLVASRALLDAASVLAFVLVAGYLLRGRLGPAPARLGSLVVLVVLLLVVAAAITAIRADPRPVNDVWDMLQATSLGLVHGRNMYLQHWPAPPEDSRYYTYFPGTAVILLPFRCCLATCVTATSQRWR